MSLYSQICRPNLASGNLLVAIDLHPDRVPRIRDVWTDADMTEVTVLTRTGGGNREGYLEANTALTLHPLYLRDADEEWDVTYATFVFVFPRPEATALRAEIVEHVGDGTKAYDLIMAAITETGSEKFAKALEAIKNLGKSG